MARQSSYHSFPIPEVGDTGWASTMSDLFDAIDAAVPVMPSTKPSPTADRVVVNRHTDRDRPVLQYDTGTELRNVKAAQRWDVHQPVWKNRDLIISAQWQSDGSTPFDCDITGNAKRVDSADTAQFATEATQLDGRGLDAFGVKPRDFTVSGRWSFETTPVLRNGLELTSGTLSAPKYDQPKLKRDEKPQPDPEPEPDPEAVAIQTLDPSQITSDSVQLNGEVLNMGGYESFYCFFEFATEEDWQLEGGEYTHCGPSREISEAGTFSMEYPAKDDYGKEVFQPDTRVVWRASIASRPCESGWHGDRETFELAPESPSSSSSSTTEATTTSDSGGDSSSSGAASLTGQEPIDGDQ